MRKSLLGIMLVAALLPVNYADAAQVTVKGKTYASATAAYVQGNVSLDDIFAAVQENDMDNIDATFQELLAADPGRGYNIYAAALKRITDPAKRAQLQSLAESKGLNSNVLTQIAANNYGSGFKLTATSTAGIAAGFSFSFTNAGGGGGGCTKTSTSVC